MDDDNIKAIQLASQHQRLALHMLPTMIQPLYLVVAWILWCLQGMILYGDVLCVMLLIVFCGQLVSLIHEWKTKRYVIPAYIVDAPIQGADK